MAAGKRIVGNSIPGTGLFVHESKSRATEQRHAPPTAGNKKTELVEQEEKRVNIQLVEILERKCAKQQQRAEDESHARAVAEEKLAAATAELTEVRQRLEERDRQVVDLCAAQRSLAADREAAAKCEASLETVRVELDEKRRQLSLRDAELRKLRDESGRTETEWKDQVLRLVAEVKTVQQRALDLEGELQDVRAENQNLIGNAQELVSRYEDESSRRLELEERCLSLEEKARAREQRVRGEVDSAQQKAKQSVQARERAEELARKHDDKGRQVAHRAEVAEEKCRGLEAEVQRLRSLCSDRARRITELEQSQKQQVLPGGPSPTNHPLGTQAGSAAPRATSASASTGNAAQSRLPAPPRPRSSSSRPASAASGASPSGSGEMVSQIPTVTRSGSSTDAPARMPPGTIRRAGSQPVRRAPPSRSPPARGEEPRSAPRPAKAAVPLATRVGEPAAASAVQSSSMQNVTAVASAAPRPAPRLPVSAVPPAAGPPSYGSRPCSRASSDVADPCIEAGIPSEPDSSDDEVITAMAPARR